MGRLRFCLAGVLAASTLGCGDRAATTVKHENPPSKQPPVPMCEFGSWKPSGNLAAHYLQSSKGLALVLFANKPTTVIAEEKGVGVDSYIYKGYWGSPGTDNIVLQWDCVLTEEDLKGKCVFRPCHDGVISAEGSTYDLADGRVFLVSPEDGTVTVTQLDRDISAWGLNNLSAVADDDAAIKEFLQKSTFDTN